jgi:hypothetical protein
MNGKVTYQQPDAKCMGIHFYIKNIPGILNHVCTYQSLKLLTDLGDIIIHVIELRKVWSDEGKCATEYHSNEVYSE